VDVVEIRPTRRRTLTLGFDTEETWMPPHIRGFVKQRRIRLINEGIRQRLDERAEEASSPQATPDAVDEDVAS
jgi:hypothetical protein